MICCTVAFTSNLYFGSGSKYMSQRVLQHTKSASFEPRLNLIIYSIGHAGECGITASLVAGVLTSEASFHSQYDPAHVACT